MSQPILNVTAFKIWVGRPPGGTDAGSVRSGQHRTGAGCIAGGGRVCRRLDIAGIIDRAAPVREIAHATHGQIIEAMVANRLTSPTPMIHVAAWARQFAVEHALGLGRGVLNDDRIARALDALAPVLEQVTGSVGAAAIGAYGVDVSQLHWDMTSVSLTATTGPPTRTSRSRGSAIPRTVGPISSRSRPASPPPPTVPCRCSGRPTVAARVRSRRWSARWKRYAGWLGRAGFCSSVTRSCCPTPTSPR